MSNVSTSSNTSCLFAVGPWTFLRCLYIFSVACIILVVQYKTNNKKHKKKNNKNNKTIIIIFTTWTKARVSKTTVAVTDAHILMMEMWRFTTRKTINCLKNIRTFFLSIGYLPIPSSLHCFNCIHILKLWWLVKLILEGHVNVGSFFNKLILSRRPEFNDR